MSFALRGLCSQCETSHRRGQRGSWDKLASHPPMAGLCSVLLGWSSGQASPEGVWSSTSSWPVQFPQESGGHRQHSRCTGPAAGPDGQPRGGQTNFAGRGWPTARSWVSPRQLLTLTLRRVTHSWSEASERESTAQLPDAVWAIEWHIQSMCNLSPGRGLVAMTHSPHPGGAATTGCGSRACSHPQPDTHPLPQPMVLLPDQQTSSLLESPVAGGREGGRAGGRAGPEPSTCFKLHDLGDGPGQRPPVTPRLAWPPQQMFPARESCWPGLRVGEGPGRCQGTAAVIKSEI